MKYAPVSADRGIALLFGFLQKCFKGHIQSFCDIHQFNICDKPLAGFNSLDSVLIDIQTENLESIRQFPLGFFHLLAVMGNLPAAKIVSSVGSFVGEHIPIPFLHLQNVNVVGRYKVEVFQVLFGFGTDPDSGAADFAVPIQL